MYIDFGLYKKLVSTLESADFNRAEFQNDKYKISDLQSYLKIMIKDDLKLKELVYEIMKDF